jgi:hypothetical protein
MLIGAFVQMTDRPDGKKSRSQGEPLEALEGIPVEEILLMRLKDSQPTPERREESHRVSDTAG